MTGRDRVVLIVLAVGLLLGGGWFGLVAPRRSEVASVNSQVQTARQQRDVALSSVSVARAAKRTADSDYARFAALGKAVPADDQMASLLFELQSLAGRSHVDMTAVTPTPSSSGAAGLAAAAAANPSGPAAPTPPSDATSGSNAVPAHGSKVAPVPAVNTRSISLAFSGSYHDLERFLRRVDRLTVVHGQTLSVRGRLIAVQGVQLQSDPTGGSGLTATITANVFTAPSPLPTAGSPGGGATSAAGSNATPAPATASSGAAVPASITAGTP